MSDENTKEQRSKRLQDETTKVKKQLKIAKQHGYGFGDNVVKQPHRLAKKHAMDCGNPGCMMCSNPRHLHKELTIQEKRFYQSELYDETTASNEDIADWL